MSDDTGTATDHEPTAVEDGAEASAAATSDPNAGKADSGGKAGGGKTDSAKADSKPDGGKAGGKPEAKADTDKDDDDRSADPESRAAPDAQPSEGVSMPSSGHQVLQSAQMIFNVRGDWVGRDRTDGGRVDGVERVRVGGLSTTLLDEVEHGYEEAEGFEGLLTRVVARRLVVLHGPAGHGKKTTAVRLLWRLQATSMYTLDGNVDLTRLAGQLRPGATYLLFDPAGLATAGGTALRALDAELERHQARLLITLGTDTPLSDGLLRDYLVEHCPPPEPLRVLVKHLDWRVGPATRTRLLATAEVDALVKEVLCVEGQGPRQARDLARIISEEIRDDGTLELTRVRDRMAQHQADHLDIWFRGLPDLRTRCHAVALAVLNGMPTEYVAEASVMLRSLLEPQLPAVAFAVDAGLPRYLDPFLTSRATRLRRLRAHTRDGLFRDPLVETPVEVERYDDDQYAAAVLHRAWREYEIQGPVLDWLNGLVRHESQPVRMQSAYALGLLTADAFEQVQRRLLQRWAASDQPKLREAVAIALQYPASDPRLRGRTSFMVRRWMGRGGRRPDPADNPNQQATAALAYGYALGVDDPKIALTSLDRLAMVDKLVVARAIGQALGYLLMVHDVAIATDIYVTLLRWLGDRERTLTAQLAFLVLAETLYCDADQDGPRPRAMPWPTLLAMADQEPTLRGALAELWHRVLSGRAYPEAAAKALQFWAADVEWDDRGRQVLASLARAAAEGRERTRFLLLRETEKWTDPKNLKPKPKTAAAIRAALAS